MPDRGEIDSHAPRAVPGHAPGTFRERGVAVPFTAPLLGGARVRPAAGHLPELIVADPLGGRGVAILPWDGVVALCRPTLHDRILFDRVAARRPISPRAVRPLALDVARQGLAGRAAAAAAAAAGAAETRRLTLATADLLLMLVRQACGSVDRDGSRAALARQARHAVAAVAPLAGVGADAVPGMLEEIAVAFAPLGIGEAAATAPVPASIASLAALADALGTAFRGPSPPPRNSEVELVIAAAEAAVAGARATLEQARALLLDLPGLLRAWAQAPARVAARAERAEWLLDGWPRICLLGQAEPQVELAHDPALLDELADLVPAMPREASLWVPGAREGAAGTLRQRPQVPGPQEAAARAGGSVLALVARNERLQARELAAA